MAEWLTADGQRLELVGSTCRTRSHHADTRDKEPRLQGKVREAHTCRRSAEQHPPDRLASLFEEQTGEVKVATGKGPVQLWGKLTAGVMATGEVDKMLDCQVFGGHNPGKNTVVIPSQPMYKIYTDITTTD